MKSVELFMFVQNEEGWVRKEKKKKDLDVRRNCEIVFRVGDVRSALNYLFKGKCASFDSESQLIAQKRFSALPFFSPHFSAEL